MKTFSSAVEAALADGSITVAYAIEILFDTPVRISSAPYKITLNGNVFEPAYQMIGFEEISRSIEMSVEELTLNLAMSDGTFPALFYGNSYHNKTVSIYRAFIIGNAVDSYETVTSGKISSIADDDTNNAMAITVRGSWAAFEAVNSWRTTPASHKKRYPTDDCFKYAHKASETIYWGGTATTGGSPSSGAVSGSGGAGDNRGAGRS